MKALNLKTKADTLEHTGHEETIARARELKHLIDSATAELAALKGELIADATSRRLQGESTVTYAAPDKSARVTWARKFADVPESELPKLVEAGVADGFAETVRLKLKPKSDTTELAARLLDAGINPRDYFTVAAVRAFCGDPDDPRYAEVLAQIQVAPGVYL